MTLTQPTSAQVHGKVVLHMVISTVLVFLAGYKAAHHCSSSSWGLSRASPFAFTRAACLPADPGKTNSTQQGHRCAQVQMQQFARWVFISISGYKYTDFPGCQKNSLFWCNRVGRGFSSCFIRCHSEMQQGANSPQHSACEQRVYISICLGVDFIAAKFLFPFVLRVSIILTHRTSSHPIPKGFTGDHVISPNSLALWVAQVLARCAPCSCSLVSAEMPPAFHSSLDKPGLAHGFS